MLFFYFYISAFIVLQNNKSVLLLNLFVLFGYFFYSDLLHVGIEPVNSISQSSEVDVNFRQLLDQQIESSHNLAMQLNKEVEVKKTFYESPLFGLILFSTFGLAYVFAAHYYISVLPLKLIYLDNLGTIQGEMLDLYKIENISIHRIQSCCVTSKAPEYWNNYHTIKECGINNFIYTAKYETLCYRLPLLHTEWDGSLHSGKFLSLYSFDSQTGAWSNIFSDTYFIYTGQIHPEQTVFLFNHIMPTIL